MNAYTVIFEERTVLVSLEKICESSEGNTKSPNEREFIVINCAGSNRVIPNRGYELSEHMFKRIIDKSEHVNHSLAR